ncbi:MAG: hypothetical protein WBB07_23425 [Mycobacterium sp.]
MSADADLIRAQVDTLLAELPDVSAEVPGHVEMDLDDVARRLEEIHDVLVHALESVEKG